MQLGSSEKKLINGVEEMGRQREESVPKLRFCLPSFNKEQSLALKEKLLGDRV